MKQIYSLFILISVLAIFFQSDLNSKYYRVFYKDKGPDKFIIGSSIYNETMNSLSKRAIARRNKVLTQSTLISIDDAPVYQPYIDSIIKLSNF